MAFGVKDTGLHVIELSVRNRHNSAEKLLKMLHISSVDIWRLNWVHFLASLIAVVKVRGQGAQPSFSDSSPPAIV